MIMQYIVGTFLPDAVPQSGNFHITNKCAVVKNTFTSLSAMRIVQINENRTDKPVVVKLIKISCSAHLPKKKKSTNIYLQKQYIELQTQADHCKIKLI